MAGHDLLIVNAIVVDGTGSPGQPAAVAVRGDTIVAVGEIEPDGAGRVIDGAGLVLAPGFIDIQAPSDWSLLLYPTAESQVRQGVTTEVVGNCGQSAAPCYGADAERIRTKLGRRGVAVAYNTMAEYLDTLANQGIGINVAALVGHGVVRRTVMGHAKRAPDAAELTAIRRHVADSLAAGAFGMSWGGVYPPSSYARTEELIEVSKEVAAAGGIYTCHVRNEHERLLEAVEESIRIGRESGAPVQISHLKAGSKKAWGKVEGALDLIEKANTEGVLVTVDQYPYTSASTWLKQMVPDWAHEDGQQALIGRLRDPAQRVRIREGLGVANPVSARSAYAAGDVLVSYCPSDSDLEGKPILDIAAERGVDPRDAVLDIVIESNGEAGALYFGISEDDVRYVMRHPLTMFCSDAASMTIGSRSTEGKPHPRTYGTFARILGHYVRDEGVLPLEEAIAKMTSRPAAKLGLADRGTIAVGKKADLVLFSAERVRETSTFQDPHQYAEGVEMVILNGRVVVQHGEHTGTLAGRVLRHT